MPLTLSDTIISTNDTVSFILRKDSVKESSGTLNYNFSEIEVIPTNSRKIFFEKDTVATIVAQQHATSAGFEGKPIAHDSLHGSVFFLFFTLCFVIFSYFFRREGQSLTGNFKNLFSYGDRNKTTYKQQITTSEVWGEVFLLIQSVFVLSILFFIYFWNNGFPAVGYKEQLLAYFSIFAVIAVFLLLKYIVYRIIGFTLPKFDMSDWTETYLRLIEIIGVISFLPAMIMIYLRQHEHIAISLIIITIALSLVLLFRSLLQIFVKNKIGFLYFIVYLCAVEIAPYFILYKGAILFINYVGSI